MEKEIEWLLWEKYGLKDLPEKPSPKLKKDLKRLKTGEPLAYVIGFVEFLGNKIDLRHKTLIPRAETELLTEEILRKESQKNPKDILDIFSGSGAIGIAAANYFPKSKIILADLKENAIRQIKKNIEINHLEDKARVIRSDVWKKIDGEYDLIFANPPYVPKLRAKDVSLSVKKYEPKEAVFGGKDGLDLIRIFLKDLGSHLRVNGKAYMEFDSPEKEKVVALAKKIGLRAKAHKDHFGKWRYLELSTF